MTRTRKFYDEQGFAIPAAFDRDQRVAAATWGVIATPTNYLIDRHGRIVWRHYGFRRGDQDEIRARLEEVLADQEPLGLH